MALSDFCNREPCGNQHRFTACHMVGKFRYNFCSLKCQQEYLSFRNMHAGAYTCVETTNAS